MSSSSNLILLQIGLSSSEHPTIFDNELHHPYEFVTNETSRTQFELGEALGQQDHNQFNKTVGVSLRSASTLLLALVKVFPKYQSQQERFNDALTPSENLCNILWILVVQINSHPGAKELRSLVFVWLFWKLFQSQNYHFNWYDM